MLQKIKAIVNDLFKRHRPGRGIQPKTIEDAMKFLHESTLAKEMTGFVSMHEMNLHHTVGQQLRNSWGLWHGSDLAKDFVTRFGLVHADDMSGYLLERLWREVHQDAFNYPHAFNGPKCAYRYQRHWRIQCGTPLPCCEWAAGMRAPIWSEDGFVLTNMTVKGVESPAPTAKDTWA